MTTQHEKTMPARDERRKPVTSPLADLPYDQWRQDIVFQIYGPQGESRAKTRRGRAV